MIYYKDLKGVITKECGEPLLSIEEHLPEIICRYQNSDMHDYTGNKMPLRKGCLLRLRQADEFLKAKLPMAKLLVVYGYRHPEVQQKYFLDHYQSIKYNNSHLNEEELLELVHQLIAVPEVAGHPTGGSIDLTVQIESEKLDMGTSIADFSDVEKIPTFSKVVTEEQRRNRLLLRSVMMQAGFAPYDGEWWHFSYGDKEWAYYYRQPFAIYEQISYTARGCKFRAF